MNFLPDNYKEPVQSNYMSFDEGDNTFRVLSHAIVGMEYWKSGVVDGKSIRKPVRKVMSEKINLDDLEINPKTGELDMPKHFWAFVVYNREVEKIQILEVKQKKIQRAIKALVTNPKWGDPKEYDITVSREGEGLETEYTVMPNPKERIDEGIVQLYKDMDINLEALFKGDDPFGQKEIDSSKIAEEVSESLDHLPFS